MRRFVQLPHQLPLPKEQQLKSNPNIRVREQLIEWPLAAYIMGTAAPFLAPATVHDATKGEIADQTRTNSFVNFRLLENDMIKQSVNERMLMAMQHPSMQGDPLSLLHYQPGQQYAPHYDFFDPDFPAHRPHLTEKGQRVKTGLLYLNDDYEGGETRFHDIDYAYHGKTGDFLMFGNVDSQGQPDRLTLHSGEPPTKGEKWILSKWARTL